jgi:HK97 family phage major capsid protein/HK97 family phage prohead protease
MPTDEMAGLPPARLPFPVARAMAEAIEAETRADAMPTMTGHFSTFNSWYEVDSVVEGHFLERVGPGAFDKTISESRGQMKVLYDHGQDPTIGNKVLGSIDDLRTDRTGPKYTVSLFDTSYNRDLVPGLQAGVYGSSFRFTVEKDTWDHTPSRSRDNPAAIPERTINEARVYEFGPVTFPANPQATAGIRATTDDFYRRSRDPEGYEALLRSARSARTPQGAATPSTEPPTGTPSEPPASDTPRTADPSPVTARSVITVDQPITSIEDKRSRVSELIEGLERQAAYPGVMPADDQVRWDTDVAERDRLMADIAAWEQKQANVRAHAAVPGATEPTTPPAPPRPDYRGINVGVPQRDPYAFDERSFNSLEARAQGWRDDAMKITEITRFPDAVNADASRNRISNLLDYTDSPDKELARRLKVTGSPLYKRAFEKIMQQRGTLGLTPEEQRGTALAVGVDGTGGYTVPFAFDPTIVAIGAWTGAVNPYRRSCRVVSIVGTDTWNALTSTAVTATRTTEAAPAVEQGPTFAQPQYIVKRVQGQITASFEMFQDRPDLASEMGTLIQEAKDNEEEQQFAIGVGTTVFPLGVGPVNGTSGAYTSLTTATSVTLAALDFDAVEAALPVRHRFGAQWFLNRSSIRKAQTLETAGGKYFGGQQYQAVGVAELDRAGNTGLRLLGYPVNESPSLPTASTANIVIGTLLAPSSYVIVERVGMSVQFIPFILNSSALATGQQALYFMWRNDARPINVDAGRTLRYLT